MNTEVTIHYLDTPINKEATYPWWGESVQLGIRGGVSSVRCECDLATESWNNLYPGSLNTPSLFPFSVTVVL
jgi:hypothetical protein